MCQRFSNPGCVIVNTQSVQQQPSKSGLSKTVSGSLLKLAAEKGPAGPWGVGRPEGPWGGGGGLGGGGGGGGGGGAQR